MVLIKKGAEADLFLEDWHGHKVIKKTRKIKAYRLLPLDYEIRRSRTYHESNIMHEAKLAGVPTPIIFMVDVETTTIVMQHIHGTPVKERLQQLSPNHRRNLSRQLGRLIGRLHKNGIIHGDLTTSNMLVVNEGRVYFIDFGLAEHSRELEKRGVDLHLMKRALYSTHYLVAKECFKCVIAGYTKEVGKKVSKEVVERIDTIAERGRYT